MRASPPTVLLALCAALPGSAAAQAAKIDLSPAAAARTLGQDAQVEPASRANDEAEERALARGVEGLVRAGQETREQARDRAATGVVWTALRPWKGLQPLLHEVRYWYAGRGIDAAIADDGSVSFHDKDGVVAAPLPLLDRFGPGGRVNADSAGSPAPSGRMRGTGKISPGIGISDAVRLLRRRGANEDPHSLERADFLERTRALRDWLAARARDRAGERATQELLHELRRIWSAAELSTTQRQQQTFALWDGCEEDEFGARGRAAIVDFLHRLAAARGECAFVASTLTKLNASRRSREAFAPCE